MRPHRGRIRTPHLSQRWNLHKRCDCPEPSKCRHPYWFEFRLHRQHRRLSTRTANRALAQAIAEKHHIAVLEGRAGHRQPKPVLLSAHIKAYVDHTAKNNRSSYKDQAVLDRLRASVGDRPLSEISAFHIERWKRERAEAVTRSTVNRELDIVRGCFSRAVDWGRLGASPLRTVRSYRVDDARLRVCLPDDIKAILDAAT
jgi:hypothetical protein